MSKMETEVKKCVRCGGELIVSLGNGCSGHGDYAGERPTKIAKDVILKQ